MKKNLAALLSSTFPAQTLQVFKNIIAVMKLESVGNKPARSTVQVARLPKDVLIEIECVAVK